MSEKKSATDVASGDLVLAPGIGAAIWSEGGEAFVPVLRKDMPLTQRRQTVRSLTRQAMTVDDRLNLIQGELLYEVIQNGYWREWEFVPEGESESRKFAKFDEYCEHELGMRKRKAYYLADIYRLFVVELEIPVDVLRDLEWAKAKELGGKHPVITKKNWKDLIEKMKSMSVREVRELAKAMRGKPSAGGADPSEPLKKFIAMLAPDQFENVMQALDVAGKMADSEKPGHCLDLICSEFLSGVVGDGKEAALLTLDIARRNLERAFGVKLEVVELDAARYKGVGEELAEV